MTEEDISRLQEAFLETFIRSAPIPPAELTLDIDAWDDPTHGNRGDGAFPLPFNLEACEALPIDYVLGLAGNARLCRAGAALLEQTRVIFPGREKHARLSQKGNKGQFHE